MSAIVLRAVGILSLGFFLGWAAPAPADELSRFSELNKIKSQKLVTDVQAALARDLDPRVALGMLRRVKLQLEDDSTLPERQRAQLLQQVDLRLSVVVAEARRRQDAEEAAAQQAAIKSKNEEQRTQSSQPGKKAATGGAYETADRVIGSAKQQLEVLDRTKFLRERGINSALNEIMISAANIEEQRITERFIFATKNRGAKLDPKEAAVLKALNSTLSVDYNMAKFKEVLEDLTEKLAAAKLHVPIIVDENSLKDAMVEYDDPVTFKIKNVTVRTILKKILGDKGLGYIVKEGTIQVVTAQRARETMVVRSYNVGDLVAADPRAGIFGRQMMLMNVQSLMNVIQNASGDPALWQQGGATISFFEPTRTLIIRAPAEVHHMLPQTFGR
jgi:hypothetical protein